jgi:hypothetical protein
MPSRSSGGKRGRSAITGRFVSMNLKDIKAAKKLLADPEALVENPGLEQLARSSNWFAEAIRAAQEEAWNKGFYVGQLPHDMQRAERNPYRKES